MGKERAYSAKPSIASGDQCRASLQGLALLLSMGAGEADGGRRGWWGQARLVGAGEANGGRKPPASCPSLRPNATKATGPNPVPTLPLWPKAFQTKWTNQLERAEEKRKQTKVLKSSKSQITC